ncbi:MAG: hypothetical protein KJN84_04350, partial [Bacteroidia bacterium]|nr:hypothetical protein [Bacteroidia bacterium]
MANPLTMVDGNLEGYQREEGAFATSPNYIYKIKSTDIDLIAGDTYTLLIDRNDGTEAIEASTTMLGESDLKFPVASNGIKLPFSSIDLTRLTWQTSEFARIHNLSFDFNYRERGPETNGLFEKKTIEWRAVRNLKSDETRVSVDVEGVNFYTFLRGAIPIAQGVERRFEDITIKVQSGGEEINEFLQIASANVGITSTQDPPFFSNVEGGRGVFSSTYDLIIPKVALTNQTIDSIKDGQYTSELNFTN